MSKEICPFCEREVIVSMVSSEAPHELKCSYCRKEWSTGVFVKKEKRAKMPPLKKSK